MRQIQPGRRLVLRALSICVCLRTARGGISRYILTSCVSFPLPDLEDDDVLW